MKLSVIIPTHNRADILKTCLEKLIDQQGVDFEIIVVDDGSADHTEDVVTGINANLDPSTSLGMTGLHYLKQKASHQGIARNMGVKEATGNIIVFIGDDIFVEPDFLKKHHDRHADHPNENVVVLGYTTWDPKLEVNSYMKFLEDSGWQFGYRFLKPKMIGRTDPYKFFYTSNISLKKSFFEKEWFDESFAFYGWEDIELGYRLWRDRDMEIYYEPQAIAYHHHHISPSDLISKMRNIGKSAVHFQRLQPDVRVIPMGLKARAIKLASNKWTLPAFKILGENTYYKLKSWQEFFRGVEEKSNRRHQ